MPRSRARTTLSLIAALQILFLLAACSSAPGASRAPSAKPTVSAPSGWVYGRGTSTFAKKCGDMGGDWIIDWKTDGASDRFVATVDKTTLSGTYVEDTWQTYDVNKGNGSITSHTTGGTVSLVVQADGTVVMTTAGGVMELTLKGAGGTTNTTDTGGTTNYKWLPAVDECKA
jgi:hypothetical protein